MRKLLYILLLSPSVLSLGHDVYFFTQNPDRGFMLSDLGFLWDKYHKESHDQWKMQVVNLGENFENIKDQVSTATGIDVDAVQSQAQDHVIPPQYAQEIKVEAGRNQETTVTKTEPSAAQKEDKSKANKSIMVRVIGFLLQQKAILIFPAFTFIIFCMDMLVRGLFALRPKRKDKFSSEKKSKKGDAYKYGRK
jgi:hypothetical protein